MFGAVFIVGIIEEITEDFQIGRLVFWVVWITNVVVTGMKMLVAIANGLENIIWGWGFFGVIAVAICGAILAGIYGGIVTVIVENDIGYTMGIIIGIGIWGVMGVAIGEVIYEDFLERRAILMTISGFSYGLVGMMMTVAFIAMMEYSGKIENVQRLIERNFYDRHLFNKKIAFYLLTTTAVGISTGIGFVFGFNLWVVIGLLVFGLPLALGLIYPPLKLWKLKKKSR